MFESPDTGFLKGLVLGVVSPLDMTLDAAADPILHGFGERLPERLKVCCELFVGEKEVTNLMVQLERNLAAPNQCRVGLDDSHRAVELGIPNRRGIPHNANTGGDVAAEVFLDSGFDGTQVLLLRLVAGRRRLGAFLGVTRREPIDQPAQPVLSRPEWRRGDAILKEAALSAVRILLDIGAGILGLDRRRFDDGLAGEVEGHLALGDELAFGLRAYSWAGGWPAFRLASSLALARLNSSRADTGVRSFDPPELSEDVFGGLIGSLITENITC